MIKQERLKFWQIIAQFSNKLLVLNNRFWRRFGNEYSQRLIWYCDICKNEIKGTKYEKRDKDFINRQYCETCYKGI